MFIKNQYVQNRFVLQLLEKEDFELLTYLENSHEYLLRKTEKRKTTIIRVSLKQFDWKRDLSQSIIQTEKHVKKNITLPFFGKNITFHHLFIVDYPPVDDWEELNSKLGSTVYFWTTDLANEEMNRFIENVSLRHEVDMMLPDQLFGIEYHSELMKQRIKQLQIKKEKAIRELFQYRKPFLSYILIVFNVMMFIMIEIVGDSTNTETLIRFGAKYNVAIIEGEWWRIVTSMFLHIGMLHIAFNMLALYFVGTIVEKMYGSIRFLLIYFLAGIAGGIASFALSASVAAGASGAIFGLLGALLFFGSKHPKTFQKTMGPNVIFIVILNIIFGFSVPQIDNGAHIGGLIGGFLAASCVGLPKAKAILQQVMSILIYIVFVTGILLYGLYNDEVQYNETIQLQHIQSLIKEKEYQEIKERTTKSLVYAEQYEAELLFYRSSAHLHLEEMDLAINDLEAAVKIKPDFEEAWFNLTLFYQQVEAQDKALATAERLVELNSEDSSYQELYQTIKRAGDQ